MKFFSFVRKNRSMKTVFISIIFLWVIFIAMYLQTKYQFFHENPLFQISYFVLVTLVFLEGIIIIYRELKKVANLTEKLNFQHDYDLLTGLLNARRLYEDVEKLIERQSTFYFAYGSLNNIKYLNNKFGFYVAKDLIVQSSNMIKKELDTNTSFYHYGGDEYVLVIQTTFDREVHNILRKVLRVFENEISLGEIKANISFAFGVVKYPTHGKTVDELIKNASIVMEDSKFKNKNTFVFFEEENLAHNLDNQELDLYVSKMNLELFEVYLMPIVSASTNVIGGFECLTRVMDDKGKYMHTETVINSLERNGRIQELDEIVFAKMLSIMKRINREFEHEIFLSLNASALSMNEAYVDKIIRNFKQAKLNRGVVVLELTESEKVDDQDLLIGLFKRLNAAGIMIGIDDFGTGYSSLSYISKFPIYAIKIDKEFVRDFKENDFNVTLVKTLNSIANSLGCKLVAEGVEHQETLNFLIDYKVPFYQGYLFSKGVPLENAILLLKENAKLKVVE